MTADPTVPARSVWAEAMTELGAIGDRLTAEMRARGEEVDADVHQTLMGAVMDGYLTRVCAEADHPTFVPCCGWFQRLGFPNPDTVYRSAAVHDTGTYRLTGERGTAWQVSIMPFTARMQSLDPVDLSDVAHGPDGRIELVIGPERPPGHQGDWLPMQPGTASLWLRSVSARWGAESEPRLAIERLDAGARRRPSGDALRRQLRAMTTIVEGAVRYGISHVDDLAGRGFVNRLELIDYGASGGMPLQSYHEGLYDLADDEALVVEATLPDGCDYFSWSLTDRMLVTLDWTHAQTSLNRSQATVDTDGVLRVVVAGSDPGVRNWMDTTGYQRGVLQCRSIGSVEAPTIEARVVPLGSVADELPAGTPCVTPEERAAALSERRIGFQLRSLW